MPDSSRRSISRRLRFEILRRDGHTCRYCGATAPDAKLTVDHVIPVSLGGSDDPTNLVAACSDCNAGKSSSAPDGSLIAQVADDAVRWARAMQLAFDEQLAERGRLDETIERFDIEWSYWHLTNDAEVKVPRDVEWERTVRRWLAAGLDLDADLVELISVAMNKRGLPLEETWRYFCGCVWRRLTERQEAARELIRNGVVDEVMRTKMPDLDAYDAFMESIRED